MVNPRRKRIDDTRCQTAPRGRANLRACVCVGQRRDRQDPYADAARPVFAVNRAVRLARPGDGMPPALRWRQPGGTIARRARGAPAVCADHLYAQSGRRDADPPVRLPGRPGQRGQPHRAARALSQRQAVAGSGRGDVRPAGRRRAFFPAASGRGSAGRTGDGTAGMHAAQLCGEPAAAAFHCRRHPAPGAICRGR